MYFIITMALVDEKSTDKTFKWFNFQVTFSLNVNYFKEQLFKFFEADKL